jgi:hypothetical protein
MTESQAHIFNEGGKGRNIHITIDNRKKNKITLGKSKHVHITGGKHVLTLYFYQLFNS